MRFAIKRGPESLSVSVNGKAVPVAVKRNARARRLILRVDPKSGAPVVTLPHRMALREAALFVDRHAGWLERRLEGAADAPFCDGSVFPLRGEPCRVFLTGRRGLVRLCLDGEVRLEVPGDPEHAARRVTDWLKRQARRDLSEAVEFYAARLGRKHAGIRIGDARSRWGSCSSRGALAFSWRLVLAPPSVLRYVAAHEVAHLAEMNHSRAFWTLVRSLDPDFGASRLWLKENGAALHAVGRAGGPGTL